MLLGVSDPDQVGRLSTGLSQLTHGIGSAVHCGAEGLDLSLLGMGGDEGACLAKDLWGRRGEGIMDHLEQGVAHE